MIEAVVSLHLPHAAEPEERYRVLAQPDSTIAEVVESVVARRRAGGCVERVELQMRWWRCAGPVCEVGPEAVWADLPWGVPHVRVTYTEKNE